MQKATQILKEVRGRWGRNPGLGLYAHHICGGRIVSHHDVFVLGFRLCSWNVWHIARKDVHHEKENRAGKYL